MSQAGKEEEEEEVEGCRCGLCGAPCPALDRAETAQKAQNCYMIELLDALELLTCHTYTL